MKKLSDVDAQTKCPEVEGPVGVALPKRSVPRYNLHGLGRRRTHAATGRETTAAPSWTGAARARLLHEDLTIDAGHER